MLITMGNVLTRNANLAENTDSHMFLVLTESADLTLYRLRRAKTFALG